MRWSRTAITVVEERLTQQDIADRVGASRDMIGKLMKDLVGGGYLAVEDRQITILKTPAARLVKLRRTDVARRRSARILRCVEWRIFRCLSCDCSLSPSFA